MMEHTLSPLALRTICAASHEPVSRYVKTHTGPSRVITLVRKDELRAVCPEDVFNHLMPGSRQNISDEQRV